MKLEDVLKVAFVLGLAGAGFVYMAERSQRRQRLEQLKIQNGKLTEAVELLRLYVEERNHGGQA